MSTWNEAWKNVSKCDCDKRKLLQEREIIKYVPFFEINDMIVKIRGRKWPGLAIKLKTLCVFLI